MSHAISTIGKLFGLQRVCQVLDFPRATIYAERARALSNIAQLVRMRRGPKPKVPDHELLAAIHADLARTRRSSVKGHARYGRACASRTTSAYPDLVSRG